jgi:hypothetical protein
MSLRFVTLASVEREALYVVSAIANEPQARAVFTDAYRPILQPHLSAEETANLGGMAESFGIAGVWVSNHLASRDPFVNFVHQLKTPYQDGTTHVIFEPLACGDHPGRAQNPTVPP